MGEPESGDLKTLTTTSLVSSHVCTTGYPAVESAFCRPHKGQAYLRKVKVLNYIETTEKKVVRIVFIAVSSILKVFCVF